MTLQIPLLAVPNQVEAVPLDGRSCIIAVNQRSTGLFIDVFMDGEAIVTGVLCEDRNPLVRDYYRGFPGELFFFDTEGSADPTYEGLASRYQLIYIEQSEVEAHIDGS